MDKHNFRDMLLMEISLRIRKYLMKRWREAMTKFSGITYASTNDMPETDTLTIPESSALREMIKKFSEYRDKIALDKDKKEFDDFLDVLRKSSDAKP